MVMPTMPSKPPSRPEMLVLRWETVRGRRACGHLMNGVPGLRSPVQSGSARARRRAGTRLSTRANVVSVHRMRDVNVDTHQRRSRLRRVVSIRADGSHRLGTFLTAKRACAGRARTATLGSPERGGANG